MYSQHTSLEKTDHKLTTGKKHALAIEVARQRYDDGGVPMTPAPCLMPKFTRRTA